MRHTAVRQQGRVSWWLVGGIGCLGVVGLCLAISFVGLRQFQSTYGETIAKAAEMEQKIRPRLASIYDAIEQYAQENNGNYPPNLNALVPKYLTQQAIAPIQMSDGTKVKIAYKRPAKDASKSTVVLEHDPPIRIVVTVFGETAETLQTLQVRKDGRITTKQETITSQERGHVPQPRTGTN